MDIKEKIEQIAEEILKDSKLLEKFKDEPVKFVEKKLGDAPDEESKRKLLFTYGYKK